MKLSDFFEISLVKTKITSANVKPKEMLIGYFAGPFCALISNAIFSSYLIDIIQMYLAGQIPQNLECFQRCYRLSPSYL